MFPYHDENEARRTAYVAYAIIALNILVWLVVQGAGMTLALPRSVCDFGLIPGELTGLLPPGTPFPMGEGLVCLTDPGRQVLHVFTSMFLHGSWLHLLGNMWFLWLFGNNIEDSMGHGRFVVFYLVCGVAAALVQVILNPDSAIPMVGASGAISGVMGAYLVLYPHARVNMLFIIVIIVRIIPVPAWLVLLYWFGLQLLAALPELSGAQKAVEGGVAVMAHVGGFVAGAALIKLFENRRFTEARAYERRRRRGGFF